MQGLARQLFELGVSLNSVFAANVRHAQPVVIPVGQKQADAIDGLEVESVPVGFCEVDPVTHTYRFYDGSRAKIVHEYNAAGVSVSRRWKRI